MASIDDRIVNMQFNNAQFQQGISQTNASLEKLKENLNLNGATNGIDQVQGAANRFSLANIESALDSISSKFGIFGAIGFTVIQNLTNTVINAGKSMASALIDPIVEGGKTRALAIQQAQFQFQGLGLDISATMASAKAAVLGTAFSLDQAATAAAAFGASGITSGNGLEQTLRAVAGVAAQTGTGFASVANIFETIAGNGRLMGEQLLQLSSQGVNAAAILAKSMGKTEQQVRDMVTNGDISFAQFRDAMNETFGANAAKANQLFTGALANMRAALARLGADIEGPQFFDLRDIFNALTPLIDNVHAALMPLINAFNALAASGAAEAVDAISHTFGPGLVAVFQNVSQAIITIGKAIGGGFGQIFPENTAANLTAISVFLQKITQALIPTNAEAKEIQRTFAGLFAVFDIVGQIVGTIVRTFFDLIGVAAPVGGSFLEITAKVGDFLVKVDEFLKKGQFVQNFFRTVGSVIAVPIAILRQFFGIIADGIKDLGLFDGAGKGLDDFAQDVQNRFKGLIELGNFFNSVWTGIVNVVTAVWNFLKPIFQEIGDMIGNAVNSIQASLKGLKFDDAIQILNTGIFGAFLLVVRGFFGNLGGVIRGNGVAFISQFKLIMTALRVNLKALEINTNAKTLKEIAISVALLAASAVALSLVDGDKLVQALSAMTTMVVGLLSAFKAFSKIEGTKGILDTIALSVALQGIAGAILTLTAALAILALIPFERLMAGVLAIVVVLGSLVGALALLNKLGPDVLFGAAAIALIAPAILILAGAVAILGAIPFLNLVQGMVAFVVMLGALVGALALLAKIGPEALIGAVSIALIAPALAILTGAVAALGALPFLNLLQGMGAFIVMLAALSGAILLLGLAGPEALLGAVAIAAVALSMVPLIGAVALLGAIPFLNLIQGMVAFTVALAILVGAVLLLGLTGPVALIGAAAIVAVALAIAVLAPALKLLSTIPWDGIGRMLTILSAGLGILVVMGILLIPASVGFLLLGAALLLIGTGVFLAAQGIGLLAVGIAALVAVGAGGIALLTLGIQAFIAQLPALGAGIGAAIVSMAVVIGQDAPQLINAFVQILSAMLTAVDTLVPQIIQVATDIIVAFIAAIVILVPDLVNAGLTIIASVLQGISDHAFDIGAKAVEIIQHFIDGVSSQATNLANSAASAVVNFVNSISTAITTHQSAMNAAGASLAAAIISGMTGGLISPSAISKVASAAKKVADNIPGTIQKLLGIKSPSRVAIKLMEFFGDGVVIGLTNRSTAITSAASDLGQSAMTGLKSTLSGIGDALNESVDMTPTIRPVLDLSDIQTKAKTVSGLLQAPILSLGTSNNVAQSVSLQEQVKNAQVVLDTSKSADTSKGDTIFNQYNSSPKALSNIEIYRQTRNQLSTLKGDLGVVDQSGSS